MEAIRLACLDYDMENIFNVDETGTFFRLLPKRTYLSTAENRKTARGTKAMKAKDRVSAYMCTNATGTGKVPIAIIGKSKSLGCFVPRPVRSSTSLRRTRGRIALRSRNGGWRCSSPSFGTGLTFRCCF